MAKFQFEVLSHSENLEFTKWIHLWENSTERDVYSHPEYLKLYLKHNEIAYFAVCSDGTYSVAYAFVKRPINSITEGEVVLYDIASPYGYGGLQIIGPGGIEENAETIEKFWVNFTEWAKRNSIVSDFVRFQLQNPVNKTYPGVRKNKSINIVRELKTPFEEIWSDFEKKVRKDIRKAERVGVKVTIDEKGVYLNDFLSIYFSTLDRRKAKKNYYFDEAFFTSLITKLEKSFVFFHAWHEGKIVSTELVLLSKKRAFSFLGGTFSESFHLHPNHLLKAEIIKWAQLNGKDEYVLGGGASAGDGIEKYKKSFAPTTGERIFQTGELILQQNHYEDLLKIQLEKNGIELGEKYFESDYFPLYRSPEFE